MIMSKLMNQNTLVLNRLFQAVNICTCARAFTLLCGEHAKVINPDFSEYTLEEWAEFSLSYEGSDVVHSAKYTFKVPRVIKLNVFDRIVGKDVKFSRHSIFERDKNICQYCGHKFPAKLLNMDHVIPREQGGQTTWENIVCSCIKCNSKKANHSLAQCGMKLIKQPHRPRWRPFGKTSLKDIYHPEWNHFVDLAMWTGTDLGEKSIPQKLHS